MKNTKKLVSCAVIGALYATLTIVLAPFSFGAVQCRVSEVLTVLPVFSPFSIIGLGIGCFVSNLFNAAMPLDMVIGTLATVIAGALAWILRKITVFGVPVLSLLAAPLINGIFIGFELVIFVADSGFSGIIGFFTACGLIFVEELIPCVLLGIPFFLLINKTKLKNLFS